MSQEAGTREQDVRGQLQQVGRRQAGGSWGADNSDEPLASRPIALRSDRARDSRRRDCLRSPQDRCQQGVLQQDHHHQQRQAAAWSLVAAHPEQARASHPLALPSNRARDSRRCDCLRSPQDRCQQGVLHDDQHHEWISPYARPCVSKKSIFWATPEKGCDFRTYYRG